MTARPAGSTRRSTRSRRRSASRSASAPDTAAIAIPPSGLKARLDRLDWEAIARDLDAFGHAVTPPLLDARQCAALVAMYADDRLFRSRVEMARHRFGEGDYKYFAAPLPPLVAALREAAYAHLAPIANRWNAALRIEGRFPPDLPAMQDLCRRHGQTKPTPLLLHYEAGGYNCLHQDLYGEVAFPIQMTVMLSRRGADYEGGEFLLVEQRPRAQSVGHAVALLRGQAILFATRHRPARGVRGFHRAAMRHGVSRLLAGRRHTLGIIFHDAR